MLLSCMPAIDPKDPLWIKLHKVAQVKIHSQNTNLKKTLSQNRFLSKAKGVVTLLTDVVDSFFLDQAPGLQVISNHAVGVNNIDVHEATKRHIAVCNTPDVLTNATAEYTIAMMFAVARRFKEGYEMVAARAFKGWDPKLLLGTELSGARLGIVGMGRIGKEVAKKAKALGMEVSYFSPHGENHLQYSKLSFHQLLKTSDFISIHCPLTLQTKGLFNRQVFECLKKGAFLINTARGEIVDERALLGALSQKRLAGAALDVFCNEPNLNEALRKHGKIFVLPHLGSATKNARVNMARLAISGVLSVLCGRTPQNQVNCFSKAFKVM